MKASIGAFIALIALMPGAPGASAQSGFDWTGMTSRFATDFSETEAACRVAAARNAADPLTREVADELCPKLQRMLQEGQCKVVDEDLRGTHHPLMTFKSVTGHIFARRDARVRLPFRPDALRCELGLKDGYTFTATVYVGTQPSGEQACYNVALDFEKVRGRFVCTGVPFVTQQPEQGRIQYVPSFHYDRPCNCDIHLPGTILFWEGDTHQSRGHMQKCVPVFDN